MEKFRKLNADEIDARVAIVKENGVSLLLYKDARVDMNILDETVQPENWQRKHELINGNLFCSVGIFINGEWVWKQDVGVESFSEKEKGQASDSFKRACFNWGIGRELYTAPFIWIPAEDSHPAKKKSGDGYTCYETFKVKEIGYDEKGNINHLVISNNKGIPVYTMGQPKKEEPIDTLITPKEAEALDKMLTSRGVNITKLCEQYKVPSLDMLKGSQYVSIIRKLESSKK